MSIACCGTCGGSGHFTALHIEFCLLKVCNDSDSAHLPTGFNLFYSPASLIYGIRMENFSILTYNVGKTRKWVWTFPGWKDCGYEWAQLTLGILLISFSCRTVEYTTFSEPIGVSEWWTCGLDLRNIFDVGLSYVSQHILWGLRSWVHVYVERLDRFHLNKGKGKYDRWHKQFVGVFLALGR